MASVPIRLLVLVGLLLVSTTGAGLQSEGEAASEPVAGDLLDVRIISEACMTNASCSPAKPDHLIEYFSADWCEPCEDVADHLATLDGSTHVLLQHHASPADETFLSDSKLRFDQAYRLVFIPSLVVDGTHLLTGARQALDVSSVLENTTSEWVGLESLQVNNGNLSWNTSLQGTLKVWHAQPTPHTSADRVHGALAQNAETLNTSTGWFNLSSDGSSGSFWVVMLETEGVRSLTVASLAPTGSMDVSEGGDENLDEGVGTAMDDRTFSLLVTAFLLLMLLPALGMHRSLMAQQSAEHHETKTAEE